jgi:hypothetical protein
MDGGIGRDSAPPGDVRAPDAGLPDGACRSDNDCSGGFTLCVGAYYPGCLCESALGCASDSDCDAGDVCRGGTPLLSACLTGGADSGMICAPPCRTSSDCFYWEECLPNGHCQPLPCDKCPSYLSCPGASCQAKACTSDGDCPGGYCVDDTCQGQLGTCQGECA